MALIKVAFVSRLYPLTHYSLYLGRSLASINNGKLELIFYRSKSERVRLESLRVKDVWSETIRYPFQIFREVLKDRPDVVHVQHEFNMFGRAITALMFPVLLFLLRLSGNKTVVTMHAVVTPSQVDAEFARKFAFPKSLWPFLRLVIATIYLSTLLLSFRTIVHAGVLKHQLERSYPANAKRIWHIPHGVEDRPTQVVSGKWTELLMGKKVILFFGYLGERKGVEYLLHAFREISIRHPNWMLVVAGGLLPYSGPYVTKLTKLISELGLKSRTIFLTTTPFPPNELHELFEMAEFVVLPYTMSISASAPLSFAMGHGKPVVATDLGALAEEIEDGNVGLLCKPEDAQDLFRAMNTLIDDPIKRRTFALNMKQKGMSRNWSTVAQKTYELYRDAKAS
jgi:glycosyltransferase involved in cell wall biosynthesis